MGWLLLLQSTGSRHAGFSRCSTEATVAVDPGLQNVASEVVARGLSYSPARGLLPEQGWSLCGALR